MSGVFIDNESGEFDEPTTLVKTEVVEEADSGTITEDDSQASENENEEQNELDTSNDSGSQDSQETTEQPKTVEQPKQQELVNDPGEFKPGDYSFDITLADGTVIRVEKPEDIAKLPKDADFGEPAKFFEVQANYQRMLNGLDADKRQYEDNKKAFDEQQETIQQQEQRLTTYENELSYLESKGKLPAVPAQYANADWSDPEIAKQPGVKERLAVINYAFTENQARQAAGLPAMGMLEAYNEMRMKAFEAQREENSKKQNEVRKKRGAMVGGVTVAESSSTPSDMLVGSGGSLNDI